MKMKLIILFGMVIVFLFGSLLVTGEEEKITTIKLDYTSNIDVHYTNQGCAVTCNSGLQSKWVINSIPPDVTIIQANQYMYGSTHKMDGNVTIWRIDDQSWTESISNVSLFAQVKTNETNITTTIAQNSWHSFNVTNMVKTDYDLGNDNTTIRFEYYKYYITEEPAYVWDLASIFFYGNDPDEDATFDSSEYIPSGTRPFLNITYLEPSTEPIRSQSFFIKQISRFIIKSTGRFYMKK
jgi:hypothetical protein